MILQPCFSQRLNQRTSSRATARLFQRNRPERDIATIVNLMRFCCEFTQSPGRDRVNRTGRFGAMLAPGSRYEEAGPAFIGQQSAVVDSMQLACTQLLY